LQNKYGFIPFQFEKFDQDHVLLVNLAGDHYFLPTEVFSLFIAYKISTSSDVYKTLKSKFFTFEDSRELEYAVDLLANQIRSKQRYLQDFTSLQMIEVTNYCNLKCSYCHASTVSLEEVELKKADGLQTDILDNILDKIFQSPSKDIKVELQGGEPLANWKSTKYLIENAYARGLQFSCRNTEIILCTNLLLINNEKLNILKKYNVQISTSLDGTEELHDKHRITSNGVGSYKTFIEKLYTTRKALGDDTVNALLTVSRDNLFRLPEVIDEYIHLGFSGVFIRALNPYGMATKNIDTLGYSVEDFVSEYIKALNYIIELNKQGTFFVDYYSSLLLSRILTPFSTGFMDLQTPAGAGISGAIYDFNGDVYPTDESRMLARVGDTRFKIGNVVSNTYDEIFNNPILKDITEKSVLYTTTSCSNCVYNAYCGSDPIRNFVESGDIVGYRPNSAFCKKNKLLFKYLLKIIQENDNDIMNVFWSWISRKNIGTIRV
jgi:uncharacterized protein